MTMLHIIGQHIVGNPPDRWEPGAVKKPPKPHNSVSAIGVWTPFDRLRRKRHILADTIGLIMAVVVTSAAMQERDSTRLLLCRPGGCCKKLRLVRVDGGYRGK